MEPASNRVSAAMLVVDTRLSHFGGLFCLNAELARYILQVWSITAAESACRNYFSFHHGLSAFWMVLFAHFHNFSMTWNSPSASRGGTGFCPSLRPFDLLTPCAPNISPDEQWLSGSFGTVPVLSHGMSTLSDQPTFNQYLFHV